MKQRDTRLSLTLVFSLALHLTDGSKLHWWILARQTSHVYGCVHVCPACSNPGPTYTVPFLGSIVEMVQDPHAFWERQRAYSFPGLSWNSIVTKFTVMVTDPAVIRHVFQHNR